MASLEDRFEELNKNYLKLFNFTLGLSRDFLKYTEDNPATTLEGMDEYKSSDDDDDDDDNDDDNDDDVMYHDDNYLNNGTDINDFCEQYGWTRGAVSVLRETFNF